MLSPRRGGPTNVQTDNRGSMSLKIYVQLLFQPSGSSIYSGSRCTPPPSPRVLTLSGLVPLPCGSEVCAALAADEGCGHGRGHGVKVQDPVNALLQPGQVDELSVRRVRDEVHLRRRGLGGWDLEKSKLNHAIRRSWKT